MSDTEQDRLIRTLAPEHRVAAATLSPTGPAATALLQDIMATGAEAPRRPSWRRWLVAVPVVATAATAAFVVAGMLPASGPTAPVIGPEPARAGALQIDRKDGFLEIVIRDPAADPARYREELARHGLDIELSLAPAAPDQIGRVIFSEEGSPGIEYIESPGNCTANGNCSVGVRVPLNYRDHAAVVFGRAARPGEDVEGGTPEQNADANGLVGRLLAAARKQAAAKGQTLLYRLPPNSREASADEVPGTWIIYDAAPIPGNQIVIWASADGKPPPFPARTPPQPSPTR
ncbi:hypothetical protein GCM10009557_68440 [Virgisporangium ochraceum]